MAGQALSEGRSMRLRHELNTRQFDWEQEKCLGENRTVSMEACHVRLQIGWGLAMEMPSVSLEAGIDSGEPVTAGSPKLLVYCSSPATQADTPSSKPSPGQGNPQAPLTWSPSLSELTHSRCPWN